MNKPELTQEIVREFLDYDIDTGNLTWKQRGREWFDSDRIWKCWNSQYAGKEAGYNNTNKYGYRKILIAVFRKRYLAHRVIWLWMTGEWPKDQIDHINRDATDNRWSNLREATSQENNSNASKMSNNTSGVTGVTWCKHAKKWMARVYVKGRYYWLGYFAENDLESAAKAVEDFRREQGFSEGHGQDRPHLKNAKCT